MRFKFNKSLLVVATLVVSSCQNNDVPYNGTDAGSVAFGVTVESKTRVTGNVFENGDAVAFDAYKADGELYADNISYSYHDGVLSSTTPIKYPVSGDALSFVACYPATKYLAKTFTYTTTLDQSSESSYEGNDLLIARVDASHSLKPSAVFKRVMSRVIVNIKNSGTLSDVKINAKNKVSCNTETMSFSASGSVSQITPQNLGGGKYMVLVAPQSVSKGDKFITAKINGSEYAWNASSSVDLQSGYNYEIDCTLGENIVIVPTDTYNVGWAELPNEPVDEGNYYYAHHKVTLNGKSVRNFSACYSDDYTCPVWVAGPYHTSYCFGSGDRRNNYKDDPQIDCYQVETLGSPYNRGHMIASSDRLGNQDMNNQAFYLSNIAPQLISGFNSGGGIWNNYEDAIQEWYQNRTDTLYVVNGCNWENTNKKVDGTTVPTHYYKALLRCKNANSKKSVLECSASELECVAFYLEHKSSSSKPSASHMISIEALEQKTGFKFFTNVPNAPKSTFTASDWL